jgi:hypothetical protein
MAANFKSFNVSDPERWGMLVKSWSTGVNYFDPSKPPPSMPRTLEDLLEQCTKYRCGATVAEWITGLAIMTYGPSTLGLRIPPAAMIQKSEARIKAANTPVAGNAEPDPDLAPGDYPIPDFYPKFLALKPTERDLNTLLKFHHKRIGEYTVNSCQ